LLARVYADVPAQPSNLTTQERNELSRAQHVERNHQIRALFAQGVPLKELAAQFGISTSRVHQIIRHRRK